MHIYLAQTQTRSEPQQTQINTQFFQRIPKFPSKTGGKKKKQTTLRENSPKSALGGSLGATPATSLGNSFFLFTFPSLSSDDPRHGRQPPISPNPAPEKLKQNGGYQNRMRRRRRGRLQGWRGGRIGRPWEVRRASERPKVGAFSTLLQLGSSSSPPPSLLTLLL